MASPGVRPRWYSKSATSERYTTSLVEPNELRATLDRLKPENSLVTSIAQVIRLRYICYMPHIISFPYRRFHIKLATHGPDDHISREIDKNRNFYEAKMLEYIASVVPPGGTWIDAGACIGTHTVFFATVCEAASVVSYEPHPANFQLLKENIRLNGISHIVLPFNAGISADGRAMDLRTSPGNFGNTDLVAGKGVETIAPALDSLILRNVRFLKIDCEGMSMEVFSAFLPIVKRYKPHIAIECGMNELKAVEDAGYTRLKTFNATPTHIMAPL